MESEYEIHGKARNDVVKVVESEYEIHSKACDDVVKVVESLVAFVGRNFATFRTFRHLSKTEKTFREIG